MRAVVAVVIVADLLILLLVLLLPLLSHAVEQNLEAFLFAMGLASALAAGVLDAELIRDALLHPLPITGAVLVFGLLFLRLRPAIGDVLVRLRTVMPLRLVVILLITALALLSSVITVIIASLILVELIGAMRFRAEDETRLVVIACMAIGLGAALTPIGEPLATIATAKLRQDFWFLLRLLGPWVIPGIVLVGVWAGVQPLRYQGDELAQAGGPETARAAVLRAARVYLFVMALTLLGEGFRPLIDRSVIHLDARLLYWINMVSAVLDNATLTAAEISPRMSPTQVRAVLMGLLISGGMLIPGNIPNIIAAGKLKISSRAWAAHGVPLGLGLLVLYFLALFFV
jgi:predicted cation transporter